MNIQKPLSSLPVGSLVSQNLPGKSVVLRCVLLHQAKFVLLAVGHQKGRKRQKNTIFSLYYQFNIYAA